MIKKGFYSFFINILNILIENYQLNYNFEHYKGNI